MIQVEKDVPYPESTIRRRKYPWDDMTEIGCSFFAPGAKSVTAPERLKGCIAQRQVVENGVEGTRAWRIK